MSVRRNLLLGLLFATALPAGALAQVGHDPTASPYRDLRIKHTLTFIGGHLGGGRGKARVGPSGGENLGLRYDIHVGGAATVFAGASFTAATRNLVDPDEPEATRYFGTADQDLLLLDGGFNLILTGRKTWRGFAPYLGAAMGAVIGSTVPEDSSGFAFETKFQAGPMIGVRYFVNRRFHFRLEARDVIWRLTYGSTRFFNDPLNAPGDPPVLDPRFNDNTEWVHHSVLSFGIGWTLRL